MDILRTLPDEHRQEFVTGLRVKSIVEQRLGLRGAALETMEKSVALGRQLAASDPETGEGELAFSLAHHANLLYQHGEWAWAAAAAEEAAALYERQARPDVVRQAASLSIAARAHARLGRPSPAAANLAQLRAVVAASGRPALGATLDATAKEVEAAS